MKPPLTEITVKRKLDVDQLFKISRFKQVIKRTRPHKHDAYLELIFLSEGSGFHWIDTRKYQIQPPHVFLLSGQMHYWELTAIPKGFVLLVREGFFDPIKHQELQALIAVLLNQVEIQLPSASAIEALLLEIEKEHLNPNPFSPEVIRGYLQVLLVKLIRGQEVMPVLARRNSQSIFGQFIQFIRNKHPITNLKVAEAARHLGLSPQHLTSVCRKHAGRSASDLIVEQVILESKRYLLHSDKTVSEIAFLLSFSDPSHFVKYFKKTVGDTPQTFRSKHFQ